MSEPPLKKGWRTLYKLKNTQTHPCSSLDSLQHHSKDLLGQPQVGRSTVNYGFIKIVLKEIKIAIFNTTPEMKECS